MKQVPRFSRSVPVGSLVALLALAAGAYCKGRELPENQCVFDSDCDNNQVCAGRFCRQSCNNRPNVPQRDRDRDCPTGYTCRPADNNGRYACYPPNQPYRCLYHSECDAPLICARDGFCRNQCASDYDCFIYTLNRASMCVREADAGTGTCDFRLVDGGTGDASGDASTDAATPTD